MLVTQHKAGVADGVSGVTAWPSALTVAASWDRDLMRDFAAAMAVEQRGKGTNVMLGPMVNIARVPVGGEREKEGKNEGEEEEGGKQSPSVSPRVDGWWWWWWVIPPII